MIQKVGQNFQIQRSNPSFRAKIPAANPISSIDPKTLSSSLEIMGANNLASINIQNPLLKLEKEVFEPLLNFKGTKKGFAKKAYSLIINHKRLEGIAPPLKFEPLGEKLGLFNYIRCYTAINDNKLKKFTRGDILNILRHEVDHFEKFGDIACIQGAETFTGKKLTQLQSIKAEIKKGIKFRDLNELAVKRMNGKYEMLKDMYKDHIVENLTTVWRNPSPNHEIVGTLFPDGFEALSKEDILSKLKNITPNSFKDACLLAVDKEIATTFVAHKEFWTNFVAKKGRRPPEQLSYDIKPMIQDFESCRERKASNSIRFFEKTAEYYNDPLEPPAFEAGLGISEKWDKFLAKKGITPPKNYIKDNRDYMALIVRLDKHLTSKFPEAQRSEELSKLISKAAKKLKVKKPEIWDELKPNILQAILEDLEPKNP
ncbi:MAG: hypothetical protein WCF95_03565 [bacterium]